MKRTMRMDHVKGLKGVQCINMITRNKTHKENSHLKSMVEIYKELIN